MFVLSLLDIFYKKALGTIFFERDDLNDQKEINNFLFQVILFKATLMQIWKSPYMFVFIWKW